MWVCAIAPNLPPMRRLACTLTVLLALAGCGGGEGGESTTSTEPAGGAAEFDAARAFADLKAQVRLGPRPSRSPAQREAADLIAKGLADAGATEITTQHPWENVLGTIPGSGEGTVVVGAHYDTKDIPGFVGANDGAGGTAVVTQIARTLERPRHTLKIILFDGEETPRGTPDRLFVQRGLRGAKVAAPRYRHARAMVLLDFVADRHLSIPREGSSDHDLWRRLRAAATAAGVGRHFPAETQGTVEDDHLPFLQEGVPAIDLIDFDFPCWHRLCDDLSAVSERSLDASGEAVTRFLASL